MIDSNKKKVLIVGKSFLNGLVKYLIETKKIDVVGITDKMESGFEMALTYKPHIVLLSVDEPIPNYIKWVKRFRKMHPKQHVIIIADDDYLLHFHTLVEAGVSNILSIDAQLEYILQVIECTLDEKFIFPHSVIHKLNFISSVFTEVELKTLTWVISDYTNAQISKELNVSIRTVESRLTKIYEKLEVTSRKGAIRKIMQFF